MDAFNTIHGMFLGSGQGIFVLLSVLAFLALGFIGARLLWWTLVAAIIAVGFAAPVPLLFVLAGIALLFNIPLLRRRVVTSGLMKVMQGVMPKISETERVALEAGVVWVEKDLFSGKPDFKKMLAEPYPSLAPEEKAFVQGPVARLCAACNDWEIWKNKELPKEAWDIIKKEKFLGMIIPKEYGGLGFSALAHSEVIMTLATRSIPACISVMVPNSLGPAELLVHYGTEEQKRRLLPKLASGEEIPCFALTEPTAGSDAGSLQASGVLFRDGASGELCIRLNWKKRWITLAAISTTVGLAFRLKDPDNLLGKGVDVGITCALIPASTKGVVLGRRHDPLGVPFYNCPTEGHDVVVSAEKCIVGGLAGAGKGWKMLMECLAAGRGISLPAQSVGLGKLIARAASAHATIRKQFGMSIGRFEGVEEPLARIAMGAYVLEAMRRFTCGALDKGIKPPVITAMAKYNSTEMARTLVNDGMDILGGAAISRGPRNLLAHPYIAGPIGITVEGANIMTRTLIIFGQGALRAHPYAYQEVSAIERGDLAAFDRAFWGHIGHVISNSIRALLLGLTRGRLSRSPVAGPTARYYKKLAWASARFAIMADIAMGALGGELKLREKITGRFADILSWMYMGFATLRRFEAEGQRAEDLPLVEAAMAEAFGKMHTAFDGLFANLAVPGLTWLFKGPIRWWNRMNPMSRGISDPLSHRLARLIQSDSEQRDRLCAGLYYPTRDGEALKRLEQTFKAVKQAEAVERKLREALKEKKLAKQRDPIALVQAAVQQGIITLEEAQRLQQAEMLRLDAITVDDFSQEEYLANSVVTAAASAA